MNPISESDLHKKNIRDLFNLLGDFQRQGPEPAEARREALDTAMAIRRVLALKHRGGPCP